MSDRPNTCRACSCQLEGRDVYEGICRSCREEEILAGTKPLKKRKTVSREAQPPPEPSPAAPPPASSPIDMDADTKELLALEDPAPAFALDPPPEPPSPPAEQHATAISFAEFHPAQLADDAAPPDPHEPSLSDDTTLLVSPVELDEELPVVEPEEHRATDHDEQAERAAPPEDEPPGIRLSLPSDAEPQTTSPLPSRTEQAPEAPPREPAASAAAEEESPYTDITLAEPPRQAESPAGAERPAAAQPRAADHPPGTATELVLEAPDPHSELAAKLDGLASRLDQLTLRLDGLAEQFDERAVRLDAAPSASTGREQVVFGFRAFVGFVLGLGVFALVAIGLTALAGLLFYPPALDLLRRAAAILGG